MAGGAAYRQHRRSSSFIGACFAGSPVYEDEDGQSLSTLTPTTTKPPSKILRFFSLPRNQKKTVPFDADAHETPMETKKDNNSKSTTKSHRHRRQFSAATASSCLEDSTKKSGIIHISSKSDSHIQQSPLHQLQDSAHAATATSHPGTKKNQLCYQSESDSIQKTPKKCDSTGKLNPDAGILIVMVILATLVLFGRASAIVCMSIWFYLAPRRRAAAMSRISSSKKGSHGSKNECSGEDKRRVVLQGLLERNIGRKLSRSVTAPSGTM